MAQKLLRKVGEKRKVAPKKAAVDAPKRIVLVGTYGPRQLEKWPGYYNYPLYGKDPLLAKMLPKIVTELPRERLRVCETAVQLDFLRMVETKETESFPFPAPTKGKFTFIDLFAGIGGIRLGYQLNGGRCVFSSEWDKDAAKTYYYNFGERPHGDIQKIDPETISDFDILLAGFPCQPFSNRWRNAA